MKKETVEKRLTKLLFKVWKIYKKYNPEGKYLNLSATDDYLTINNMYWKEDKNAPLDVKVSVCHKTRKPCKSCKYSETIFK